MRRSVHAALIVLGLMLVATGTATANPNDDYAGSHMPRSGRQLVSPNTVFSSKKRIIGVDVSNHQNCAINWKLVARKRAFAFIKASEGDFFVDGCFDRNWRKSKAVGLPRGAYDFAHPGPDPATARAEARWYMSVVRSAGGFSRGLPPALDLEINDSGINQHQMRRWIKAWIDEIHRHTHRIAVVMYANQDFWNTDVGDWRPKHGLFWGARWGAGPPVVPAWDKVSWWQYTDGSSYGPSPKSTPGIPGPGSYSQPGDHDQWLGSKSDLKKLTQPAYY